MVRKETLGAMHPATAEAYEHLAHAYHRQYMTGDVIKAYKKAIHIRQNVVGHDNPRTEDLVCCLEVSKHLKAAKEASEQELAMKAL